MNHKEGSRGHVNRKLEAWRDPHVGSRTPQGRLNSVCEEKNMRKKYVHNGKS